MATKQPQPSEGPWQAIATSKGYSIANGRAVIATVPFADAQAETDATLIAAARELLEAATKAESVFAGQKWREDMLDPEAVALRALRAAIAKATGKAS